MLEFYRNKVNELSAQDIHSSADGVPAKAVEVCLFLKKKYFGCSYLCSVRTVCFSRELNLLKPWRRLRKMKQGKKCMILHWRQNQLIRNP